MTLAELDAMVEDKKIIRHHGQVFFNARSAEEARRFAEAGATVNSYEIRGVPGWEVYISTMLDLEDYSKVDVDENVLDFRGSATLDYFRARDGYVLPEIHRGAGYV